METIETLREEIEKLRLINSTKSDLISISAHQLRTSLSALKWILKMFIDKDLGELTAEQNDYIKKAFDSNERMLDLINNLLTLNHADDTSIAFDFTKVDVVDLIDQTILEFSGETEKKGISIIFSKPVDNIPMVYCDTTMIRVVLQNLIENAIKYSNKGDKVDLSVKCEKDLMNISVHDSGIGIHPEDQSSIFGKFFRAQNATDKDAIGSGLGLYTTKHIVERHKGNIWFESTPESGTTFYVALPIN